ncbi:MAG: hypothetical protein AAGI52_02460 [Bacteroidota bacterium]
MTVRLSALALLVFAFGGCASIDEAVGVPDSLSWSYFQAPAAEVAIATQDALRLGGLRVEGITETNDGGYVISVSFRNGSADYEQIRIQPYTYEIFESRAQTYPQGRPLPSSLRVAISGEL